MSRTDRKATTTVKRVDALTPAQAARMPEWRDKWIAIGLRTGPANRPKFEQHVRECYLHCGMAMPKRIIWVDSPWALAIRAPTEAFVIGLAERIAKSGWSDAQVRVQVGVQVRAQVRAQVRDQVDAQVRDQVRDQVGVQVDAQVGAQVRDQVDAQVDAQVRAQVRDQVGAQVDAQVRDQVGVQVDAQVDAQVGAQVRDQVRAQVGVQVGAQVRDQVDAQVDAQVRDQVGAQVRAQVRDQVRDQGTALIRGLMSAIRQTFYKYIGGQFWPGWWYGPAFVSFFREVCSLEIGEEMSARAISYAGTVESACWWWPHKDFVMVCERPTHIDRDASGRLHSESRQAIAWPDGWGLYRWHGFAVPEDVVTHPEAITVARIDAEQNAELRRIMVERYGTERFMRDAGAMAIHHDETGDLYERRFKDGTRSLAVHVRNSTPEPDGTVREFWLRVHPELRPLLGAGQLGDPQELTARGAVASTFGLRAEDYHPEAQS